MMYWGARATFAGFIWLFILSETMFYSNSILDEVTFFSSIILFVFPFLLDYININQNYNGTYLKNIPLILSLATVVLGIGGLMSDVLTHSEGYLIIFDQIHINQLYVWIFLVIWVIFAGIDVGYVEPEGTQEERLQIRNISRKQWLDDKVALGEDERIDSYVKEGEVLKND